MPCRAESRRRLHFEPLEPRWTMDAQTCFVDPISAAPHVCVSEPEGEAASPANDVQQVEQALNQFALDLYKTISDSATDPSDQAISPLSISAALALVYAGARGETAAQLANALHVDLPPERFHAAMQTILQDVLPDDADSAVQFELANSLWGQSDFPFLDSFRQLLHDRYGADMHEVNFKDAPGPATDAVNDWVKTQTHDMIKKLFDSPLSTSTRFVLANALYFKSSWANPFPAYATQRTAFHRADGTSLDVSMMHQSSYFSYTESSDYQIAELTYKGGRYSMVVLLPKNADADLDVNFSAGDLQTWLTSLHSADLSVALPKFKLDTSYDDLPQILHSLGIIDAFSGSADFSGIDGQRDLYISKGVHKAVVEVDETGTEAAAATGFGMVTTECMCSPPPPIPFFADHPFHFLIRDRQTSSILFLGQVQEPSAYDGNDQAATALPTITIGPPRLYSPVATNPANAFDVNGDGEESPSDALIVINYLNGQPLQASQFQLTTLVSGPQVFADVDGDRIIAPIDALILINRLNGQSSPAATTSDAASPEGESAAASQPFDSAAVDALLTLDDLATISNRPAARRSP